MPRKSKAFLRRSRAVKKGWRTRRRNQAQAREVEIGYDSSKGNGFRLVIAIRPYRKLSDANVVKLCERLLRQGFFDGKPGAPRDLQWTATVANYGFVIRRSFRWKRGTAQLLEFERI